jgi:isoaspartyl peptidase/L-asparaginase-like protein (Ntn-hydrolase superfamily)
MAARNFLNPVSISGQIMEKSPHCALTGEGALEFAKENNFKWCDPEKLKTDTRLVQLAKNVDFSDFVKNYYPKTDILETEENVENRENGENEENEENGENGENEENEENEESEENKVTRDGTATVSMVALDSNGNFACATSTG